MAFHAMAFIAFRVAVMATVVFAAPKDSAEHPGGSRPQPAVTSSYAFDNVREVDGPSLKPKEENFHGMDETFSSSEAASSLNTGSLQDVEVMVDGTSVPAPVRLDLQGEGDDSGLCDGHRREHIPEVHADDTIHRAQQGITSGGEQGSEHGREAAGDDSGLSEQLRREHIPETRTDYTIRETEGTNGTEEQVKRRKVRKNAREAMESCSWHKTVVSQLQRLRCEGQGWELMWLAVLRRIAHRQDPEYERWCRVYLRPLRAEFGERLCHRLYTEPLHSAEFRWASQVEFATFQAFCSPASGRHDSRSLDSIVLLPSSGTLMGDFVWSASRS